MESLIRITTIGMLLATSLVFASCAGDDEVHVEPSRESLSSPGGNVVDLEPTPFGTPTQESDFWTRAAMSGMAEVEFSQLALDKVQSPEIREFAERMIKEHSKINEELRPLASSENISLPTELDPEHRVMKQNFTAFRGLISIASTSM